MTYTNRYYVEMGPHLIDINPYCDLSDEVQYKLVTCLPLDVTGYWWTVIKLIVQDKLYRTKREY